MVLPAPAIITAGILRACHGIFGCGLRDSARALCNQRRLIAMMCSLLFARTARWALLCDTPLLRSKAASQGRIKVKDGFILGQLARRLRQDCRTFAAIAGRI